MFVCVSFHLQVEKELKSICNDILDVLDKHLILAANTGESKVFYYKMYVFNKCVHVSAVRSLLYTVKSPHIRCDLTRCKLAAPLFP